ncbi:pyrrolidone-carboxylate peptidase [Thermosinus carboxydivorans Nor1]|uniref:Pyrrolidone-carboxylate peptidase n=1 Tax=Thermosinus carboxydivorans Nor1 TaxID=401526 RepID=A1HQX8_9FIRM|nr:pyroglutamyl-peptidase I [Thermosinus carboxydivorans]EAX47487.1 pyrrolidone-carboxylate peptidase [Thermosinus carboxydivorans Nor1]
MKKVLVTGFGPFGGEPVNPALEAIKLLNGRELAGACIVTRELPVVRQECIDAIIRYIAEIDPVIVLAVGQAGGRLDITPERVAINVDDFRIKDNAGNQVIDEPVVPGGPAAYFSTLPIKAMVQKMKDGGIPATVSNTAGTFICNHLFYGLMHHLAQEGNIRRGGFVHIPYLPEQAVRNPGQPSMSIETIVKGLELAIQAALTTQTDARYTAGQIC